jgi:hypothetical protein
MDISLVDDRFLKQHQCYNNAKQAICLLMIAVLLWGSGIVTAQEQPKIEGPITALRVDGDHLLIGQGSTLVEAQITAGDLRVIRATDLKRHRLRALATTSTFIFALTEDGLTTLDKSGQILDFVQGGGQRLAVKGQRIYIAALAAGIRILSVDAAGKLTPLGTVATLGPAQELAPEGESWIWVAEGDSGVRLYDAQNPAQPTLIIWLGDMKPASVVRTSGTRLFIGYANHLTILDTLSVQTPRLLGSLDLDGANLRISDLLLQGPRAFIGRVAESGADVVQVSVQNPKTPVLISEVGNTGTGEQLALHTDDVFIGSSLQGLTRTQFSGSAPKIIATWKMPTGAESCQISAPTDPQPPSLGDVEAGPITLTWKAACNPTSYELRIDGKVVAQVKEASYTFTPQQDRTSWQVIAIDANAQRVEGPVWTFETALMAWLATPIPVPETGRLYIAPVIDLSSPRTTLIVTCAAFLVGLIVVIGVAWVIGTLADRRTASRH